MFWPFSLIKRYRLYLETVRSDASRLIERFGDQAYYEAQDRAKGRCINGDRPFRHWVRVKREIARRQGGNSLHWGKDA